MWNAFNITWGANKKKNLVIIKWNNNLTYQCFEYNEKSIVDKIHPVHCFLYILSIPFHFSWLAFWKYETTFSMIWLHFFLRQRFLIDWQIYSVGYKLKLKRVKLGYLINVLFPAVYKQLTSRLDLFGWDVTVRAPYNITRKRLWALELDWMYTSNSN